MNRQTAGYGARFGDLTIKMLWAGLAIAAIAIAGVIEFQETGGLTAGVRTEDLFVFKLIGCANLLLAGSAVLYVGHLWFTAKAVGQWASGLAAAGAITALAGLAWRWIETYYLERPGHVPLNSLYEMMALFSAVTVVIYLVMERVYRTRAAGAFVMLIVLAAILFQVWLEANDQALATTPVRMLRTYWMHAHVLGMIIGYGAFTVAAAMGVAYLVRMRDRAAVGASPPSGLTHIEDLMHHAVLLGVPVFGMAIVLGALWARQEWGRYWAWDPKETWALLVWLTYASYFHFRYVSKWSGRGMAWWAIGGFGITVFGFLGTRAMSSGLHAIG